MLKYTALALGVLALASCDKPADVASRNLSTAADNFEVNRRIVFYNGITNQYILTIEGLCSIGNYDSNRQLSITCKTGPNSFKKHFLGLSDNVTYFAQQIEDVPVSIYRYKVMFRPETLVPDIQMN